MDEDVTARLSLPLLRPGQAQKELFHNEALALIDVALQASVLAVGLNAPPADPVPGACWVVGQAPEGAWGGQAGSLAGWTPSGWRFVTPAAGFAVWSVADAALARFGAGGWRLGEAAGYRLVIDGTPVVGMQRAPIADVSGGETRDAGARSAIAAILAALRGHGLIAS